MTSHLPSLLPEGITCVTLQLDAEGRVLAPGAPWAGIQGGSRLDAVAPEFPAIDAILQALRTGEIEEFVKEPIMRMNGSEVQRAYRLSLRSAYPDSDPAARQTAGDLVLDIQDVTEVYCLRKEVTELKRQAEVHRATIDMVAHDLNTPLTTLQGFLELAAEEVYETGNDAIYEYMRIMQGCTERIMFTVNEMYDVVSYSAGHLHLSVRTLHVSELLRRVVQENKVFVDRRHQELIVQVDQGFPLVQCDEMRVLQIFQNLISNASKYSPPHTPIKIRVAYEVGRTHLRFTVSDQGRGIPASELPLIFERAYRSPNDSDRIKGAGLGLYLARILVELQGGQIGCNSVMGKGSDFYFTLPIAEEVLDLY